jgi:hypothetical protein
VDAHDAFDSLPQGYRVWSVRTLLDQINRAIHAWVCSAKHGKQLTSSVRIMELFEHLKVTGKSAVIPEVIWDFEGHEGTAMVGGVWRYYI